jgi:hypothetical protein
MPDNFTAGKLGKAYDFGKVSHDYGACLCCLTIPLEKNYITLANITNFTWSSDC